MTKKMSLKTAIKERMKNFDITKDLVFTHPIEMTKCSDEEACFLVDMFLTKETKRSKKKLYKYLDKKLLENSKQIGEGEEAIRYYQSRIITIKDEIDALRQKNGIYFDTFENLEKELYNDVKEGHPIWIDELAQEVKKKYDQKNK